MSTKIPRGYAEIIATYGNPAGQNDHPNPIWEAANIVPFTPPYSFVYIDDQGNSTPVSHFQVHRLIVDDLTTILTNVYNAARLLVKQNDGFDFDTAYYDKRTAQVLAEHGCNVFGGSYVYRNKRGQTIPSVHSFGVAIDFDPAHNAFGSQQGKLPPWFIKAFVDAGWEWGGSWSGFDKDWMHMQRCQGY